MNGDSRPYFYILDETGEPQPTDDMAVWAAWWATADRHVGEIDLGIAGRISTVFLGMNHRHVGNGPPVLWETMVFGGPMDGYMRRYTSSADALEGHEETVWHARDWTGFLVATGDYGEEGWVVE